MKSSRSALTRNARKTRRLLSDSSDDSDNQDSSYTDSTRAEKFTRRRHLKPLSSTKVDITLSSTNEEPVHIRPDRTLFRLSDSSDLQSPEGDQAEKCSLRKHLSPTASTNENISALSSIGYESEVHIRSDRTLFRLSESSKDISYDDKNISSSMNESFVSKSPQNNFNEYRNTTQSNDDDQSKSSDFDMPSNNFESENDNSEIEEVVEESIQSLTEDIATNESFFITPKTVKTKRRIILDSSDENDVEKTSINNSDSREKSQIVEYESDSDQYTSFSINKSSQNSFNKYRNTIQSKDDQSKSSDFDGKSQIEMKLEDLSLIESSESDTDTPAHNKSTTLSFNKKNGPIVDKLNNSNYLNTSHSSSSINAIKANVSREKNIDVITEIGSHKSPKLLFPETIDLTEDDLNNHINFTTSIQNTNKLTNNEFESLKMEKTRLEEIISTFSQNIEKMKNAIKSINLQLLPDRGLKLKNSVLKEEKNLKESQMQLANVLRKLKKFSEERIDQTPSTTLDFPRPLNINPLIKKAAANVDINAMGSKAYSTYRAQQAMTMDVLHSLHKSLETCPPSNILADDPQGLKVELMDHQKHAIAWLMWREGQKPHGGILADDMGLGKTLTMIALVLKSSEMKEEEESSDSDNSIQDSIRNTIKGGTLIICPASLISQWENEIKSKVRPRLLDVFQHYGPNRETSARRLARKDIVISTYNVIMWDHKKANNSPLFQIKWNRIILDEAHTIRNYKSQTSVAVSELCGINKWALSGTPIHNKEADFYALLKFIKCRPFDDWAVWKRWIGNNDDAGKNRLALLVKTLLLRRTKAELTETTSFELPTKNIHTINVEFVKEEKEVYEKVLLFSSTLFASYLCEKAEKENAIDYGFPVANKTKYLHQQDLNNDIFQDHPELDKLFKQLKNNTHIQAHHILVLIMRLRQLCCHPCLMKSMLENETLQIDGIQDTGDLEIINTMSRMSIGMPIVENHTSTISNPIFKDSWVSSKIKSVCDMVNEKVLNTDDKAVIVSQWPSVLLLVDKRLKTYNVETAMFSGAIPVPKRNKIIDEFTKSKRGPKILLLSLTAGGVGLNLVAANHLFLVDIHWNPQLEAQACDRIYRVGQTKPVNVYKFICTDTIETSIQKIQSSKLALASNLLGGCSNVEGAKITLDDLKEIFQVNQQTKKN
ncbi:Hypothetical protein CINCED_3A018495 [Cinara cedri]|uniref:Transcription termination factor 2 n=1 Tax=Cinara cedri TaxID=506608 RepID=A0A5E4N8A9_9HEMI|nr:Hypothetical protein CINCED_3A018495 [Cinara cedri]